jgi:hypothetical protein
VGEGEPGLSVPGAPWDLTAATIGWVGPPAQAPVDGRPVATVGGMVSYASTPVGPYDEVFGLVALLRGKRVYGHVPFMAVDSEDSVAGGRGNWFLPKTLARFAGDAAGGRMSAEADGWRVRVTARAIGPAVPFTSRFLLAQPRWKDGGEAISPGSGRARVRPALVRVRVDGDAGPLRSGVFPGGIAERFTGRLEAPRA